MNSYLKAFFSPFKRPKLKWYIGKIAIGTPYFYPRRWVRYSYKDCVNEANKALENDKHNSLTFNQLVKKYSGYQKAVKKRIGFDFVSLGWKTKYGEYRHEWNPVWSFVFFGYQIAVMVIPEHDMHYWECWLNYEYNTDKTKTKKERIKQCIKEYPCTWSVNGEYVDYYQLILKKKYVQL